MEDMVLFKIMQKAIKENPNKHVAVMENGKAIFADSREKLFEMAKKKSYKIRCVGHGTDKRYKHFIY